MAPTTAEPVTPISAAPKGTEAGVKKPTQKKKAKNNGFRNQNSRKALRKMHAFCASLPPIYPVTTRVPVLADDGAQSRHTVMSTRTWLLASSRRCWTSLYVCALLAAWELCDFGSEVWLTRLQWKESPENPKNSA